ncbi:MAG: hypothetical protein HY821_24105, partial [Acidobacteria bacterium]|nr:hypothetical protein [Acidobacteriota bacterium]
DRIDIIGQRRRFYKIRTSNGATGWVDGRQLLSTEDMDDLKTLAERAAKAPSQGRATAFEPLNVHSAPNRQAPSFFQISPDAQADVIAHERHPRVPFDSPEFIPAPPIRPARKKAGKQDLPPPPSPKAPAPPQNWVELSARPTPTQPVPPPATPKSAAPAAAPSSDSPMDDWTLIRSAKGQTGWVLTRMLLMTIPDEVAQYAERARISAYFNIGSISDHGENKPVWLWATLSQAGAPNDFDNLRIFTWSTRRHHYETSFIERGLKGYLPLRVYSGSDPKTAAGFRVEILDKNGTRMERDYALNNFRARVIVRREPQPAARWYVAPVRKRPTIRLAEDDEPTEPDTGRKGLLDTIKDRLRR